jgi:hypothetical protein
MLYEVYTAVLRPGQMQEVVSRTLAALPARERVSPLAAFWKTEIGGLNRIVLVWPYRDLAHRAEVQASLRDVGGWPPDTTDLLASEQIEIVTPAPFMRPLTREAGGGVFEMRSYTYRPGTIPNVLAIWAEAVPERERLSPLVACWYTEIGALHRFTHVWAYRTLDERATVRAEAVRRGIWPPDTREWRLSEESSILLPV